MARDPLTQFEDDTIITLFNDLQHAISDARQSIREDVFVNLFLPFFLNLPSARKDVNMQTWYSIAGGPYNEVNVIGPGGKVIYVVPPVMSNRLVAPLGGAGGQALSSLLSTAMRRDTMIPGTGGALLSNELQRFDFTSPNANKIMNNYTQRWNDIYARYGHGQTNERSAQTTPAQADSDNGYSIFNL